MVKKKLIASVLVLLTIWATASGCGTGGLFDNSEYQSSSICPQVAVLKAPGELTRFSEGKIGGLSDVLFQARMEILDSYCEIEPGKAVYVTVEAKLDVMLGPADKTRVSELSFFVALLDGRRKVILHKKFPLKVKFRPAERTINFEETFTIQIDLEKNVDPASYSVYAGFEMTPDELEFNRRRLR